MFNRIDRRRLPVFTDQADLQTVKAGLLQTKAWFVDIPRTSSSSIRTELMRAKGPLYGKPRSAQDDWGVILAHVPALALCTALGWETWSRLYSFAVIRNPWERFLSLYNFRTQIAKERHIGFHDYVRRLRDLDEECGEPPFDYYGCYFGNLEYVTDWAGEKLIVKRVLKLEERGAVLAEIGQMMGIPGLGQKLSLLASPRKTQVVEAYDDETREIIGRVYEREIDRFKWTFPT